MSRVYRWIFMVILGVTLMPNVGISQVSRDAHAEVVMRTIGHEILLASGDSTSRILPIEKVYDSYKIKFDTEFLFDTEVLIGAVDSVIKATNIANHYIVDLIDCETDQVMYSYEIGLDTDLDLVPCRNREQTKACKHILISLLGHDKEAFADVLPEEPTSLSPNKQTDESDSSAALYLIPLILVAGLAFALKKKKSPPADSFSPTNDHLVSIGNYQFDTRNLELSIEDSKTELTTKEADLLSLLHTSANNTLPREEILSQVWGDDGDYIGRTLDVFISKLRKKLEADSNIKIVNVRGVGYKLVLNS